MGLETIAMVASAAISVAGAAMALVMTPRSKQKMKPSIDSLQVTRAEEGQTIPIVYGTVRIPGSIIWYGNLKVKPAKSLGVKGMGGAGTTGEVPSNVYLDVQMILCEGTISLDAMYNNEEEYEPEASLTFNNGNSTDYEPYATYACPLLGVASLYFKQWFLGIDSYSLPNISFKITRTVDHCPFSSLTTTGENPAIVVWDLLRRTGATIDETSFGDVATYYNIHNIGLNFVINEQQEISKILEKYVFSHVDLILYQENGIYYLRRVQDFSAPIANITTEEISELTISRIAYNQVYSDIAANYTSSDNTTKTVRIINEAVANIVGEYKNHSYDYTAFRNLDVVRRYLSQAARIDSYPISEVSFKTSLKYASLKQGDIISISYSPLDIASKQYRITKIGREFVEGYITISGLENIMNDITFVDVSYHIGENLWQDLTFLAEALENVKVLDYNFGSWRGDWTKTPLLFMAAQKTGKELGYDLYYSLDNISYNKIQACTGFFFVGTLLEDYTDETNDIDDEIGCLIEFDEDQYALDNHTRGELFTSFRVLVIDDEIMKFQTAEVEGGGLRLSGILRNSTKQAHYQNTKVWIGEIKDNVIACPLHSKIYFKLCPKTPHDVLDLASTTAIEISPSLKIDEPSRLLATRNGNDIVLEIFPNVNANRGYGISDPDVVIDATPHPLDFGGVFLLTIGSNNPVVLTNTTHSFENSGSVVISIVHQIGGRQSAKKSLTIGATDGEYIS